MLIMCAIHSITLCYCCHFSFFLSAENIPVKKGLMFGLVKKWDRHQTEYQTVADSIFRSGNNFYLQICSLPIVDSSAAVQLQLGGWVH